MVYNCFATAQHERSGAEGRLAGRRGHIERGESWFFKPDRHRRGIECETELAVEVPELQEVSPSESGSWSKRQVGVAEVVSSSGAHDDDVCTFLNVTAVVLGGRVGFKRSPSALNRRPPATITFPVLSEGERVCVCSVC